MVLRPFIDGWGLSVDILSPMVPPGIKELLTNVEKETVSLWISSLEVGGGGVWRTEAKEEGKSPSPEIKKGSPGTSADTGLTESFYASSERDLELNI